MNDSKPFAESCEQNRQPILQVLQIVFARTMKVLEIGSGTGQHAVYFAAALPHLFWQTSDRAENHPGINLWIEEAALPNVGRPVDLDVAGSWPGQDYDGVFSANTAHIMSWPEVELFFDGVGRVLQSRGQFALYGPFNYGGRYTSELGYSQNIAFRHLTFLQQLKCRSLHPDHTSGYRFTVGIRFPSDIHHPGAACVIHMCQLLHD